tara:strand:- start:129 stop:383 length:255 start_codon:yes stop_codon:yes gene_type:complete
MNIKLIKKIIIAPIIISIRFYQLFMSPIFKTQCRYLPTCSEYSLEAFKKHGLILGFNYSIKRILKCHPLGGSGFDPVPSNKKKV